MKIGANRLDAFVRSPPDGLRVAVIYGPDEGLVRERAEILGRTVVADLNDPFLVADLAADELLADPARLADEVAAISMIGGRRLVRVRNAGDALAPLLDNILGDVPGDALTIVLAGQLGPRSSLRKLAESAEDAAAIPCYADDERGLDHVIRETLSSDDISVSSDAAAWLASRLGSDRAVTRTEIAKLALYAGPGGSVRLDDAMACVGDNAAQTLEDLVYAAADGDSEAVDLGLVRSLEAGATSVSVVRAMTGHLMRLGAAGNRITAGEEAAAVVKSLRPPVFFKLERRFLGQLRVWRGATLARGMQLTLEAELNCKRTGVPDDAVCGRALLQIASLSRQQRRAD